MLGFAMRAGKLVVGTELCCRAMAENGTKKPKLIAAACDISDGTKKKITTKASYYGIDAVTLPLTMEQLGKRIGKAAPPACVAVTDEQFAEEIRNALPEE